MIRGFIKGYCQLYADLRGRGYNVPTSTFIERLALRFALSSGMSSPRPITPINYIDDYLDGYAYTSDDNVHTDAITPQILGHVYECLMGDKKHKGAYYTPRDIVDYMCREAIVGYLYNTCQAGDEKSIRKLVESLDSGCMDSEQQQRVVNHLWNVRICDPAVGAGAFMMGFLRLLRAIYAALGIKDDPEITCHIVEHNLYGMDIDAGAVEVTEMRMRIAAKSAGISDNMMVADALFCEVSDKFDIVVGNPPYFVYQQRHSCEIGRIKGIEEYQIALGGKINAYKLFLANALTRLCRQNGITAFIFQNSFLGDRQAVRLRHYVLKEKSVLRIDSFPERDCRRKRVFEGAKMSVCIAVIQNTESDGDRLFPVSIWEDRHMTRGVHTAFTYGEIKAIDPEGYTIPRLSRHEISQVIKMKNRGDVHIKCYEGELNMTTHRKYFTKEKSKPLILRGAAIQRYGLTLQMSQGVTEYIDDEAYLRDHGASDKAWHHQTERIAMQGMTGANDTRRLVMTVVPADCYLANSCNYILPIEGISVYALLAILNSAVINWYFRCFSTNSNVNAYEIERLPIPRLTPEQDASLAALARDLSRRPSNIALSALIDRMVNAIYGLS